MILPVVKRYDKTLKTLDERAAKELNGALDSAFKTLEKELRVEYPKLQSQGSLTVIQRKLLLTEQLASMLDLLPENKVNAATKQFESALQTSNEQGYTLADELIRARDTSYNLKEFSDIPVEALAFQAQDGIKRLRKHTDDFISKANAVVEQGLIQGWGVAKVARGLRGELAVTKSKAEQIARTEISSSFNTAAQTRYQKQGVEYVQWFTTPSNNVCPFCTARNGNVYPVGTVILPAHPSDRCMLLPWRKEWQELGITDDKFIVDYHDKGVADLKSRGLSPNYSGATPFEKAAKLEGAPAPAWKPADYSDKPKREKPVVPKPPKPEPKREKPKREKPKSEPKREKPVVPKPPKPEPKREKAITGAVKSDPAKLPIKLPKVTTAKEFDGFMRAHVADLINNENQLEVDLFELQDRMKLHGVSEKKFKRWLIDSYDDSFILGKNPLKPTMNFNGLERGTLQVTSPIKFPENPLIEKWHKSRKGLMTGEVVESYDSFRVELGKYVDKAAQETDNFTAIHQARVQLGDRVTRKEFKTWLLQMQSDGYISLQGSDLTGFSAEMFRDSIQVSSGGARAYIVKSNMSAALNPLDKNFAPLERPDNLKDFIALGRRRQPEFYQDIEGGVDSKALAKARAAKAEAMKALQKDFKDVKLREAFLAAERAEFTATQPARGAFERLRKRLLAAGDKDKAREWSQLKVYISPAARKERAENLLIKDLEELHLLTRGKVERTLKSLTRTDDRAWASSSSGTINIGKWGDSERTITRGKEVLFHEAGHHVEYGDSKIRDAAVEWYRSRASSSIPVPLKTIPGFEYYAKFEKNGNVEMALPGRYTNNYISKIYTNSMGNIRSTEVISMSLEEFTTPQRMEKMYANDPDLFEFFLGVLSGD